MHSVDRVEIPKILKDNEKKWTKELLKQRPLYEKFSHIPNEYVKHYKHEDIKKALVKTYKKCCCYCESPIGVQTYEHIEHLKPKSIFPDKCFDWDNLHLSCQVCNVSYKKDKWDAIYPILSPTLDVVENYLSIDLDTGKIIPLGDSQRAITTIEHTGLNRKDLVEKRLCIINRLKKLLLLCSKTNQYEEFKVILEDYYVTTGYKIIYTTLLERI